MAFTHRLPLVMSALLIGLGGLAGCSSSAPTIEEPPADSAPSAPENTETFTDTQYGYTFGYGPPFEQQDDTSFSATGGSNATSTGAVFDTLADPIEGQLRTAFLVNVYQLAQDITDADLPDVRKQLETVVLPQLATDPQTKLSELTDTTLAGLTAFGTDMTSVVDGTPLTTKMYFVFSGDIEYQVMAQAPTDVWPDFEAQFDSMFDSFTLTGATG